MEPRYKSVTAGEIEAAAAQRKPPRRAGSGIGNPAQADRSTVPSNGSVGDILSGPRFSLIHGIKACAELSATALFVNSETATIGHPRRRSNNNL
jgi:hypothetical protein